MTRDDVLLKEFLLDVGLLSRARIYTLEQDSERTGETFYQTLTSSGFLPEDDIRRAVSKSLSIPFVTPEPQDRPRTSGGSFGGSSGGGGGHK